jgi:hypothetical protein
MFDSSLFDFAIKLNLLNDERRGAKDGPELLFDCLVAIVLKVKKI